MTWWLALYAAIYFLPTLCAIGTKHGGGIAALNLLLGWTLIGWVIALVWAFAAPDKVRAR